MRVCQNERVLSRRRLLERDGITIDDVACRHRRGRGQETEPARGHVLVFVRRGCFVREARGNKAVLDPTVGYCMRPGDEQRYDHPHDQGDDCTAIGMSDELVASLWGGDLSVPAEPLDIGPQVDLEHRLLLVAASRRDDRDELVERAISLAAAAFELIDAERVRSGRPATAHAHAAIADGAREVLAADPAFSLLELARHLAISPHHLSRIFKAQTGHSLARHRMRLRARSALERLAAGEADLARLAAELGFADQSHLSRVLRAETGCTPGALRAAVAH
jgi:AraC-like DNA-binding protein